VPVGDDAGQRSRLSASEERVGRRSVADRCKFVAAQRQPVSQRQQQSVGQPQAAVRRRSARLLPVTAQWRPAGRRIQPAIRLAFDCNSTALRSCLRYDQGRLQGGSGRNLRPNWAQGGENYTLKGEEFIQFFVLKYCIAAILKQRCARMHQILFQFPFHPRTPATGGSAPRPPRRGGKEKGREMESGRRGREGEGKVCVIAVGG